MEGGRSLVRDALADNIGLALRSKAVGLLAGHGAARVVLAVEVPAVLLGLGLFAEAAVGVAALHEQLRIFLIKRTSLGLDIGADGAADVGTFVMVKMALGTGLVNNIYRTLNEPPLISVLDAQDKLAAAMACDEISIKRRAQIADVHISRGRGCKACTHLIFRDTRLHLLKPFRIFHFQASIFCRRSAGNAEKRRQAVYCHIIHIIFYIFPVVKMKLFC